MNKLSKYILLLAVIFCIVGGVLLAIGIGSGGLHFLSSAKNDHRQLSSKEKLYQMDKTQIDHFKNLTIDVSDMDVKILPSEDDSCYLSYAVMGSNTKNPFRYTVRKDALAIKEDHSAESPFFVGIDYSFFVQLFNGNIMMNHTDEEYNSLTLWLPSSQQLSSAEISSDDGDLRIQGIYAEQLTLKASYGDVSLADSRSKNGALSLGDGDAKIDAFTLENMNFTTSYGDVTIQNSSLGNVIFHSGDGDLTCKNTFFSGSCTFDLSYGEADFYLDNDQKNALSLNLQTEYGNISVASISSESDSVRYEDDDIKSYKKTGSTPENSLSIKCGDGDITLR